MIDENSSLEDVCFAVGAALDAHGITGVLTGGSAAAIYAPQFHGSLDADFVLSDDANSRAAQAALATIGFTQIGPGMYRHAQSAFTIDFPKGPLAVGGDYVSETRTIERGTMRLRILTPTDSIRDRLAHFYFWNDYTALNAAVGVAHSQRNNIDMEIVRQWTERENDPSNNAMEKFSEFLKRVGESGTPRGA